MGIGIAGGGGINVSPGASGNVLTSNGSAWTSAAVAARTSAVGYQPTASKTLTDSWQDIVANLSLSASKAYEITAQIYEDVSGITVVNTTTYSIFDILVSTGSRSLEQAYGCMMISGTPVNQSGLRFGKWIVSGVTSVKLQAKLSQAVTAFTGDWKTTYGPDTFNTKLFAVEI